MSKAFKIFFVVALISVPACADGDNDETNPAPQPAGLGAAGGVAPVLPPVRPSATASLVIQNRYPNQTITGIFLSPSYEEQWGTNQLQGELLGPGEDHTLSQIPCDEYYDLKITGSNGTNLGTVKEIYFACGFEKVVTLSR